MLKGGERLYVVGAYNREENSNFTDKKARD